MSINLTPRMKNWFAENGAHVAFATKKGFPAVIVAETVNADDDTIRITLSSSQIKQIEQILLENPYAALAPGNLGSVRAPYQVKGTAKLWSELLEIKVEEVYCTKPGAEAGIRLDTLGYDGMKEYDESRWTDLSPKA